MLKYMSDVMCKERIFKVEEVNGQPYVGSDISVSINSDLDSKRVDKVSSAARKAYDKVCKSMELPQ